MTTSLQIPCTLWRPMASFPQTRMNWRNLVFLSAVSLHAAVISGTVVVFDGGEALAQTTVTLRGVSGGKGGSTKTDHFGNFAFKDLDVGAYLISSSRSGFVPAFYGQKRWNS